MTAQPPPPVDVVARLEGQLKQARVYGARAISELHAEIRRDLGAANGRARRAEQRAAVATRRAERAERQVTRARRRARRAERELAELRRSGTLRAGRAVVAVPARVRRLLPSR